jgi:AcrR family transcriptional regulator
MDRRIRQTRAETHAQTRERLLVAARQVFARSGYGGTSVDMIAAEAGYSKGAIYSNFASKEAIFLELLARYGDEEIAEFRHIMTLDPVDAREALSHWLETLHTDEDWAMLTMELALHARRNPDFAKQFYEIEKKLTDFHAEIITERFAQEGKVPPIDAVDLSLAFRTLACGLNLKLPSSDGSTGSNDTGRIIQKLLDALIELAA